VRRHYPDAVILRPSVVFGPEDDFFNRFAAMAQIAPFLPLIGGGATRFQPVYVGDVAEAVVRAIDLEAARGKTFELGGPRVASFKELMAFLLAQIGRDRRLLPLGFGMAAALARVAEFLPVPPLTRDQVKLLRRDNVVSSGAPDLLSLGIDPTPMESVVPQYLEIFRRGGRYAAGRAAAERN
jgi:NADH dehydrogenase